MDNNLFASLPRKPAPRPTDPREASRNAFRTQAAQQKAQSAPANEEVKFFTDAQGRVIPITAPSGAGHMVRRHGFGKMLFDPGTNEPYQAAPGVDGKMVSAWDSVTPRSRDGRLEKYIPGVGIKDLGEDPKAVAKREAATAKEAEKAKKAEEKQVAAEFKATQGQLTAQINTQKAAINYADTVYADDYDGASKRLTMAKDDLASDKRALTTLEGSKRLAKAADLPGIKARQIELQKQIEAKTQVVEEREIETSRAALRKEEWLKIKAQADQAIKLSEIQVKTMTNTGRLPSQEATPPAVVPPADAVEGPTPEQQAKAYADSILDDVRLNGPGMQWDVPRIDVAGAFAGRDVTNRMDANQGGTLREQRADMAKTRGYNANQEARAFETAANMGDLAPVEKLRTDGAFAPDVLTRLKALSDVGKGKLFTVPGKPTLAFAGDELKDNGQTVGRIVRDELRIPRLYIEHGKHGQNVSPSLLSGHAYDGVPEYSAPTPQFIERAGPEADVAKAWAGQHWTPGVTAGLLKEWESSNDAERAEIVARVQPWQAGVKAEDRRLNFRELYKSGQVSLQEARHMERMFYGVQPGIPDSRESWEAFKASDAPQAKAVRDLEKQAGSSINGELIRQKVAAQQNAIAAWASDFYKRNSTRADFDPNAFTAYRDELLGKEAGLNRVASSLTEVFQNVPASSAGVLVGLANLGLGLAADTANQVIRDVTGAKVDVRGATKELNPVERLTGGAVRPADAQEQELIRAQTEQSTLGLFDFLAQRATAQGGLEALIAIPTLGTSLVMGRKDSVLWNGASGKNLRKEADKLFAAIDSDTLTDSQFAELATKIQAAGMASRGWDVNDPATEPERYDMSNPSSPLAQYLAAYTETRDPAYKEMFLEAAVTSRAGQALQARVAEYAASKGHIQGTWLGNVMAFADRATGGRIGYNREGAFSPMQQGYAGALVAPLQEMGVEVLSDLAGAGVGKLITTGAKGASKAMQAGRALSFVQRLGKDATELQDALVKLGTKSPLNKVAMQIGASAAGEGTEEAISATMQPGATMGDVISQAATGAIGGVTMAAPHAVIGAAVGIQQQQARMKAKNEANARFVDQWNKDFPSNPLTVDGWTQAQHYMDSAGDQQRLSAIRAKTLELAKAEAQLSAGPPTPAQAQAFQAIRNDIDALFVQQAQAVYEAVQAMQEVQGIQDPALRSFAHATLKAMRGAPLTETERVAVENAVNDQGLALARPGAAGYIITDAGLAALAEVAPWTRSAFYPADETAQLQAEAQAAQPINQSVAAPETTPPQAISTTEQPVVMPPAQPGGALDDSNAVVSPPAPAGEVESGQVSPSNGPYTVSVTITNPKTGKSEVVELSVAANSQQEAEAKALANPALVARQRNGATVALTQAQPDMPEVQDPTAPVAVANPEQAAVEEMARTKAVQGVGSLGEIVRNVGIMFGHVITDTGIPSGMSDRYGTALNLGTAMFDKLKPGNDIGQWIDAYSAKVNPEWFAYLREHGVDPSLHRVWFGHDPLANIATVLEQFPNTPLDHLFGGSVGGLVGAIVGRQGLSYAGQLAKDSLTKSGIPLPGTQWLVQGGVVSARNATDWLSMNVGEALSGGLAIMGTYRLWKKAKNGQHISNGWAIFGIASKIVGGVLQANPVLLLSAAADSTILVVPFAKEAIRKAFAKKQAIESEQAKQVTASTGESSKPAPKRAISPEAPKTDRASTVRLLINSLLRKSPTLRDGLQWLDKATPQTQNTSGMVATERGVVISIPVLLEQIDGLSPRQAAKHIAKVLDEELRHVAHLKASRELHAQLAPDQDYGEWRDAYYGQMWQDFTDAQRKAIREAYGETMDAFPADWMRAFEGLRIISQLRAKGDQSETSKLWNNLAKEVLAHLKAVFDFLKSLAKSELTPAMERDLAAIQAILAENGYGKPATSTKPAYQINVNRVGEWEIMALNPETLKFERQITHKDQDFEFVSKWVESRGGVLLPPTAVSGAPKESVIAARGGAKPVTALDKALKEADAIMATKYPGSTEESRALRAEADRITKSAIKEMEGIPAGQPVLSTADRNKRDRAMQKMAKAADLIRQAESLETNAPVVVNKPAVREQQTALPSTSEQQQAKPGVDNLLDKQIKDAEIIELTADLRKDGLKLQTAVERLADIPKEAAMLRLQGMVLVPKYQRLYDAADALRLKIANAGVAPIDVQYTLHMERRAKLKAESTPSPKKTEKPLQTSTGSNARTGAEMPVPPTKAGKAPSKSGASNALKAKLRAGLADLIDAPPADAGEVVYDASQEEQDQTLASAPVRNRRVEQGFYSKLADVLSAKMPNRADAQTIKGIVSNPQNGIKPEELKWSGLLTWLDGQVQPVAKQTVLDYLGNEGAVRFEEVTLESQARKYTAKDARRYQELVKLENPTPEEESERINLFHLRRKAYAEAPDQTKYSQYQLPAGQNYREIVLAMPGQDHRLSNATFRETGKKWAAFSNADGQRISPEFDNNSDLQTWVRGKLAETGYTSSHFRDVPNYVAHMRLNERTDTDGKPGLFLEEVQSDRHQAGREKGYREDKPNPFYVYRATPEGYTPFYYPSKEAAEKDNPGATVGDIRISGKAIPDAPFRKDWPLAMVKRALRDAVASGKDFIGWTVGSVQADRFDLSKQVDSIIYSKNSDGTYYVAAEKGRETPVVEDRVSVNRLPDLVGKEIAQKIINGEGESTAGGDLKLSGLDLKVGGQGMTGFYDNILPKEVQKYVKQWGAKVERRDNGLGIHLDPENNGLPYVSNTTDSPDNMPYWRVNITPAMRASVAEGQTLFSAPVKAITQRGIPTAKIGTFVQLAEAALAESIDTPQKLADLLDDTFPNGGARGLSQAMWDAIGMVKPELRGTHDWTAIYFPSAAPAVQADESEGRERNRALIAEAAAKLNGEQQGDKQPSVIPQVSIDTQAQATGYLKRFNDNVQAAKQDGSTPYVVVRRSMPEGREQREAYTPDGTLLATATAVSGPGSISQKLNARKDRYSNAVSFDLMADATAKIDNQWIIGQIKQADEQTAKDVAEADARVKRHADADAEAAAKDPNIGREFNSSYGRQKIVAIEGTLAGMPSYQIQTVGTDTIRNISARSIEDWIKRQEYQLTPEYQQEQQQAEALRKEKAEREERAATAKAERDAITARYIDSQKLHPVQKGRLAAILDAQVAKQSGDKIYRGDRASVVREMLANGYKPHSASVPAIKELTASQLNRMDNRQQAEYERKKAAAGTRTEYMLAKEDGSGFVVTKTEHDYAQWLQSVDAAANEADTPAKAEAKTVDDSPAKEDTQANEQPLVQRDDSAETADAEGAGSTSINPGDKSGGRVGGDQSSQAPGNGSGRKPVAESEGSTATSDVGTGAGGQGRNEPSEPSGGEQPLRRPEPRPVTVTSPENYVITEADQLGAGGNRQKFKDNVTAIKLSKQIVAENRPATAAEQRQLVKYVGWGGIKEPFNPDNKDWKKQHDELRDLLTPDEYEAARASIQDAHYTSETVINHGIYGALKHFGFTGGKMIEGGVGIGHMIGLMPPGMREASSYVGVERDIVTARIAQLLYPKAKIHSMAFEEADISKGTFDASASNPPFGAKRVFDKNFPEDAKHSIHNYFIAKTMRSLRPGGVGAFVVSRYFLDSTDPIAREHIGSFSEFLGAVRLPNTAFKGNANTVVTTDIVFFKRLPDSMADMAKDAMQSPIMGLWTRTAKVLDEATGREFAMNAWLAQRPDMMLGKMELRKGGGMHSEFEPTLEPAKDQDLAADLAKAVQMLPPNAYQHVDQDTTVRLTSPESKTAIPEGTREGAFFVGDNGNIHVRLPNRDMEQQAAEVKDMKPGTAERIKAILPIRDALNKLVRAEMANDTSERHLEALRARLNATYDAFQNKFGYLNQQANRRAFYDDPESQRILGLESEFDAGITPDVAKKRGMIARKPSAKKAAIFFKRVNLPYQEITRVETPQEALAVTLNQRGTVDMDYMANLLGSDVKTVLDGIQGLVFNNPKGGWQSREQYLSGNVRQKLAEAKEAYDQTKDSQWSANIAALEAVIPKDIEPLDIQVPVGAPWVPAADVSAFAELLTGAAPSAISYRKSDGGWLFTHFDKGIASNQTWGTPRMNFGDLMKAMLNSKPIVVYDTTDDDKRIINQQETELASSKAEEIKNKWQQWIWDDEKRRERLARIYNDRFNNYVDPHYDGSHLTLPGISPTIQLRTHQKNGVWRIMTDMTTLLDQVVGSGKTFLGIAAFMELKRVGRVRKPLFVVPNHLVTQWRDDFIKLYPNSNVLFAQPSDFKKDKRQTLFAKMLTGEYDAVIIGHSSFKKIGVSLNVEKDLLNEMMREILETIKAMKEAAGKAGGGRAVAQMEKTKDSIKAKLAALADRAGKRDSVATFEELGIDGLFVDEAHEFKNLFYTTQMQNVAGLGSPKGSAKAFDLYIKTRYMRKQFGGKAPVVFATGTPISNSLVEMFTMQRYLQPDVLEGMGVKTLDAWARVFADVRGVYEVDPTGTGYRMATRLANFQNVGDLAAVYRTVADVVTMADLKAQAEAEGKVFPVPKVKGGKPKNIVAKRTPAQADYFGVETQVLDSNGQPSFNIEGDPVMEYPPGTINYRVDHMPDDPRLDNMLKLTNDARKAGLDMRLIDPSLPDHPGTKINMAVDEIVRVYNQWQADKGTQLVFCDLSVPASARGKATAKAKAQSGDVYFRVSDGGLIAVTDAKPTKLEAAPDHEFFITKQPPGGGKWSVMERSTGARLASGDTQAEALIKAEERLQKFPNFGELVAKQRPEPEKLAEFIASQSQAEEAEQEDDDAEAPTEESNAVSLDELLADQSSFSVYDDMKAKLVKAGIPANEIAFIHDYDTPEKKTKLFAAMNKGEMRILFGSTPKLGAGTNVQKRLVALHHMDAPWRPSDLEQREGRIIRQGNELYARDPDGFEVEINRYATDLSYDTRMWQIIEHKAAGIEGFRLADRSTRTLEDISGEASNASDMKAATSGNPLIQKEIMLRNDVSRLSTLQKGWQRNRYELQNRVSFLERAQERYQGVENFYNRLIKQRDDNTPDKFAFELVGGKVLTKKEGIAEKLTEAAMESKNSMQNKVSVGAYRGFRISAQFEQAANSSYLNVHVAPLNNPTHDQEAFHYTKDDSINDVGFIQRLDNYLSSFEARIAAAKQQADSESLSLGEALKELAKPFSKEEELTKATTEHAAVRAQLMQSRKKQSNDQTAAQSKEDAPEPLRPANPDLLTPEVNNVLRESEIIGYTLTLPKNLERKLYERVNAALESAGGKWSKRMQSHVFAGDPTQALGLGDESQPIASAPLRIARNLPLAEAYEKLKAMRDSSERVVAKADDGTNAVTRMVEPAEIRTIPEDLERARAHAAEYGEGWAKQVDLSQPVGVWVDTDGTLSMFDGHHRWLAATMTARKLAVRDNVFSTALRSAPRVTPQQDAAYLAAVEAGDMATAQRMVDEAVKAAGYDSGTDWKYTISLNPGWQKAKTMSEALTAPALFEKYPFLKAVKFASDSPTMETRRGRVLLNGLYSPSQLFGLIKESVRVNPERPLPEVARTVFHEAIHAIQRAEKRSVSAIEDEKEARIAERQIKLADPVTRDESGAVIPLSQRFNTQSDSILYSAPVRINAAYDKLNRDNMVAVPDLAREAGMSADEIKPALQAMNERGEIYLTPSDEPRNLTPEQKAFQVPNGISPPGYYVTRMSLASAPLKFTNSLSAQLAQSANTIGSEKRERLEMSEAIVQIESFHGDPEDTDYWPNDMAEQWAADPLRRAVEEEGDFLQALPHLPDSLRNSSIIQQYAAASERYNALDKWVSVELERINALPKADFWALAGPSAQATYNEISSNDLTAYKRAVFINELKERLAKETALSESERYDFEAATELSDEAGEFLESEEMEAVLQGRKNALIDKVKIRVNRAIAQIEATGRYTWDGNTGTFDEQDAPQVLYAAPIRQPGQGGANPAVISANAQKQGAAMAARNTGTGPSAIQTLRAGLPQFGKELGEWYYNIFAGNIDRLEHYAPGISNLLADYATKEGLARAAVNGVMQQLLDRAKAGFGYPAWWKGPKVVKAWNDFKNDLLPIAAHLEAQSVKPDGSFEWKPFDMRIGSVELTSLPMGVKPGDTIPWHGSTGVVGTVFTEKSNAAFGPPEITKVLILRPMSEAAQQKVYDDFVKRWQGFPVAKELLDEFIMPGQEKSRYVGPHGVRTATFNRYALRDLFNEWPPELVAIFGGNPLPDIKGIEGYTPDVFHAKSLSSYLASGLLKSFKSGARKMKTGGARESGNVLDLFAGFNTRLMEAHLEKVRTERRAKMIEIAAKPSATVLDEKAWVPINDAFDRIYEAARTVRRLDPAEYPALTNALNPAQQRLMRELVGDAMKLRGQNLSIPKAIETEMLGEVAMQQAENVVTRLLEDLFNRYNSAALASTTYLGNNWLGNEILKLIFTLKNAFIAGIAFGLGDFRGSRLHFSVMRNMLTGMVTDRMPIMFPRGLNDVVPPELFSNTAMINQLDGTEQTVWGNLKAFNPGGAILVAMRADRGDTVAKMQLAHAVIKAYQAQAWRDAVTQDPTLPTRVKGKYRKAWLKGWLGGKDANKAKLEARAAAELWLMNYQNTPRWMNSANWRNPYARVAIKATIPFARWQYSFMHLLKHMAFDDGISKVMKKGQRAEGLGNLLTLASGLWLPAQLMGLYRTAPLTGAVATAVAAKTGQAIVSAVAGDDEEEKRKALDAEIDAEIIGRLKDLEGGLLPYQLQTSNRFNASALARRFWTAAGMEGYSPQDFTLIDDAGKESDLWLRFRNLPMVRESIVLGLGASGQNEAFGEAWIGYFQEAISFGWSVDMALALSGHSKYGIDPDVIVTQNIAKLAMSPLIPHRPLNDAAMISDMTSRRLGKSAALNYNPGPFEALQGMIPGQSKKLPAAGETTTPSLINSSTSVAPERQAELMAKFGIPAESLTYSARGKDVFADLDKLDRLGGNKRNVALTQSRPTSKSGPNFQPKPLITYTSPDQVRQKKKLFEAIRMTTPFNLLPIPREAYRKAVTKTANE